MAITGYQLLSAQTPGALEISVNAAIAAGYVPLGGPIRPALTQNTLQAVTLGSADSGGTSYTLPAATSSALGGVKLAGYVANTGTSTATTVTDAVSDLNTLATNVNAILAALQAAGIMAASS